MATRTPDREITGIAEVQDRIVVTKDRDFVDGHLLSAEPRRLLLVSTGNIRNDDLMGLFARYSEALARAFDDVDFVELDRAADLPDAGAAPAVEPTTADVRHWAVANNLQVSDRDVCAPRSGMRTTQHQRSEPQTRERYSCPERTVPAPSG